MGGWAGPRGRGQERASQGVSATTVPPRAAGGHNGPFAPGCCTASRDDHPGPVVALPCCNPVPWGLCMCIPPPPPHPRCRLMDLERKRSGAAPTKRSLIHPPRLPHHNRRRFRRMEDQPFGRASQGANESAAALVHYDGVDLPGYEMEAKGSHPDARPCGMQSLRTDRVEPRHRSVSDRQGYAGETGAGGLLSPTPLTQRGFRHGEFEQPRSKGEIRALFQRIGKPLSDEVFDKAWGDAVASTGAADAVSVEAFRAALNAL